MPSGRGLQGGDQHIGCSVGRPASGKVGSFTLCERGVLGMTGLGAV